MGGSRLELLNNIVSQHVTCTMQMDHKGICFCPFSFYSNLVASSLAKDSMPSNGSPHNSITPLDLCLNSVACLIIVSVAMYGSRFCGSDLPRIMPANSIDPGSFLI